MALRLWAKLAGYDSERLLFAREPYERSTNDSSDCNLEHE